MLLIYNIGIRFYALIIRIVAVFNTKAKQWVSGRRTQQLAQINKGGSIWFHFASLGEFEQGRPVLEQLKRRHPEKKFVITFFSPSGYEVRKNTPLADAVYYLPLDTPSNACIFIETIRPCLAVFTKYEYWYHFFNELHQRQIPLYLISGIFRPEQIFFKWYGGLHRQMLKYINQLFVQDKASEQLLHNIGIQHVQISGDTRFDRVWANALHPKALPLIEEFKKHSPLFIGGSTWLPDEELIAPLVTRYPTWKFIFAPHEINESKIQQLVSMLPAQQTIRFSMVESARGSIADYRILIIDNIGMLSALYQYADIAHIGGGFGVGIHNTLEAAAFGLPVIFGPNYQRFREARELIEQHAGFGISNAEEFDKVSEQLINDTDKRLQAGNNARQYVKANTGATAMIINYAEKAFSAK
ncbi:glycosyltransferase N-terminal domain-containing protein [Mucilaginibacter koreensis]